MFIFVAYKDPPELSLIPRRISSEEDLSQEKMQLVNPNCPVRIMLEYIRKKCRLAEQTQFDLCDDNGNMKKLLSLPTYEYATNLFDHKKTYYLVVYRMEDRSLVVLPQLNRYNKLYGDIQLKAKRSLVTGEPSDPVSTSVAPAKATPSVAMARVASSMLSTKTLAKKKSTAASGVTIK